MDYANAKEYILNVLSRELPDSLSYHSLDHVDDVLNSALNIANQENVHDEADLVLLKTAALYHDAGFIYQYNGHEERGCEIVNEVLPEYGYTQDQISRIRGMIMATKIPQQPQNHLEKIICDADLDYLGRDDFWSIASLLRKEFMAYGIVTNEKEWNQLQVKFLEAHYYFTETAQKIRDPKKQEHLAKIKEIAAAY